MALFKKTAEQKYPKQFDAELISTKLLTPEKSSTNYEKRPTRHYQRKS